MVVLHMTFFKVKNGVFHIYFVVRKIIRRTKTDGFRMIGPILYVSENKKTKIVIKY
jgi:hypothetical protein